MSSVRGATVRGVRGYTWGELRGEDFVMFRRAKLLLGDVPVALVEAAVNGSGLVVRLGLTDACGMPRCGSVRPPLVSWSAVGSEGR